MNSIDPFEAADLRYEEQQRHERQRLAELRANLSRHGLNIEFRFLSGFGLQGRIWFVTSPYQLFFGEMRLRSRIIEQFVSTGNPRINFVSHIILSQVERHLDILRRLANCRRRDDKHV